MPVALFRANWILHPRAFGIFTLPTSLSLLQILLQIIISAWTCVSWRFGQGTSMAIIAYDSGDSNLLDGIVEYLTRSPLQSIAISIALICLVTRVRTGFQNKRQSASTAEPKDIAVLPYWVPFLGHAIQFVTRFQDFLAVARSLIFSSRCLLLPLY